ncbi:MAG: GTPase Era [Cytophagales bacterium]|nr:GTPase Era [Bernardetiaceae bacterium]MDW8210530.1 GTPase Era [Cytophagales bacterium]
MSHKAGFVNIIGKPNVGKSTLMNALTGENLSIVTAKAQTTRQRIMGILSGEDFQIVYSDTPGILTPAYELHKIMMKYVRTALEDADILLWVTDLQDKLNDHPLLERLVNIQVPLLVVINKIDLHTQAEVINKINYWQEQLPKAEVIPISALEKFNLQRLFEAIMERLPEHPPYFDKEDLSDKSERFFAAEIIREKIFLNYRQEIPYCCDVGIVSFKESEGLIRISAEIYVERESQKAIVIGEGGSMLKKVGTQARLDMEKFFGKKVFLQQHVKVMPNWRNQKSKLERLGYVA